MHMRLRTYILYELRRFKRGEDRGRRNFNILLPVPVQQVKRDDRRAADRANTTLLPVYKLVVSSSAVTLGSSSAVAQLADSDT